MHHAIKITRSILSLAMMAWVTSPNVRASEIVIELRAGTHDRNSTPIVWKLPAEFHDAERLLLTRVDDGRAIDVQRSRSAEPELVWILDEPLTANQSRRYRLTAPPKSDDDHDDDVSPVVTCREEAGDVRMAVDGHQVLAYHVQTLESPDGLAPHFRRSGHIHPLQTPHGTMVTDDFCPDHAHQHGVFFAWTRTAFQGRQVDFWNQASRQGDVMHRELGEVEQGPVFAGFHAQLSHVTLKDDQPDTEVLREDWSVRTYRLRDYFLVDLDSTHVVVDEPLTINEYHYGGMGVRGSRAWSQGYLDAAEASGADRKSLFRFENSAGDDRIAANHTRPRWVMMSGLVEGKSATLVAMDHPTNFRFPQPVRFHPSMPYFCFAPMVLGEYQLTSAQPYVSRYRFLVYDGESVTAENERHWVDFAEPPEVVVVGHHEGHEGHEGEGE